jgi:hypothetical protein
VASEAGHAIGAGAFATELEAANDDAIAFVEACTDEQWRTVVSGEEWPVGVVLHHVAGGHLQMIDWLGRARRGEDITTTAVQIDADNARHARDFADVARADTVEELRRHGAALARYLRGLSPDELSVSVSFGPGNGMVVTAGQLAPIAARHCRGHLDDARAALASGTVGRGG